MYTLVEYALKGIGILLLAGLVLNVVILLLFNKTGFFVAFSVLAFTLPTAVTAAVVLMSVDFFYPSAVEVDGAVGLILVVVLGSLSSMAVFDLGVERFLLRMLQKSRMSRNVISVVEEAVASFFIAAALFVASLFVPSAELSVAAVLGTGLVCGFVRYFLGLYMSEDFGRMEHPEAPEVLQRRG